MSSYDLHPTIRIHSDEVPERGYAAVVARIREELAARTAAVLGPASARTAAAPGPVVLALECYPGTDLEELRRCLVEPLAPSLAIFSDDYSQPADEVQRRIADCITDDRVFGVMSHYRIERFFDEGRVAEAGEKIRAARGLVVVYGMGATHLCDVAARGGSRPDAAACDDAAAAPAPGAAAATDAAPAPGAPDLLVYVSLTHWEIQLRYRAGACNWKADNAHEDALRKFKRGYFFEWRVADRVKRDVAGRVDLLLDCNRRGDPRMVSGGAWRAALAQVATQPFRLVPYFDASVWGGHWMQERFGLDPDAPNFGWAFDGVPEENSIALDFSGTFVEVPAQDVVSLEPVPLLGPEVHARFGVDFPIRFDYLDTMGGGNLSLQVHPLTAYIQDRFGMAYTQDESYYILDATPESRVYLGLRTGASKEAMVADLRRAERGGFRFPDERYVNRVPVGRHDHVHIPAGTVHAGGAGTVILEISATPYIFTFKLWDWGRVGLDGLPRPINVGHGAPNIVAGRDTECVYHRLVDWAAAEHADLSQEPGVRVERTGLDELEFLETRRYWFRERATIPTFGGVNMLNLVEGDTVVVESPDGTFDPLEVHFGETFVVPASVGEYRVRNAGDATREVALVQAFVRLG